MSPLIACPQCRAWLLEDVFNRPDPVPCPSCQTPLQIEVFPALFQKAKTGHEAEAVMVDGEASCFFHPQKKAVLPCAGCGRFLCALCDCEFGGSHFCPSCLEAGKTKGKIKALDTRRIRHDNIALGVSILPLFIFFVPFISFLTAPATVFLAIFFWRSPRSLVRRSPIRFILAMVLALLQLAGWAAFFIAIFTHRSHP